MAYRANVTDRQQDILERAQFESGIPVHEDEKVRVVANGAQTAKQRVADAGSAHRSNAGVIMSHDDEPNRFLSEQVGKA